MAATEVFAMQNPKETCTAAAFTWCHMKLGGRVTPRADLFLPSDETINVNMQNIRDHDNDPLAQAGIMGFVVTERSRGSVTYSSEQIAEIFKKNPGHVGIFWNSFHTMGYAYAHHDKEYFDNNVGLYKAKYTSGITAKMDSVQQAQRYGAW